MIPEGRTEDEDNISPCSEEADDIMPTPPSPCLHELGDDDATPRQQWSPVQALVRPRSQPYGGYGSSSLILAGGRSVGGGGGADAFTVGDVVGTERVKDATTCATRSALPAGGNSASGDRPDSPVIRVDDLERLDLSALVIGDDRGCSTTDARGLNPNKFSSEPGLAQLGFGWRPGSLGGRPSSRTHGLFVTPGHYVPGPSSPPSSYSAHSESCCSFTSPTTRLISPGVSKEQGRVRRGHWKKGRPIGVGSCGNVYLGMNDDTGELMAVKEITLEAKERQLCSLYNEIQVMHKLVHPHIVGYLGAELQDSQRTLCIFQEWVPAGSLHSLLDQFGALSDAMTRKYTGQVVDGLTYLHANRVIHRDVKSKNILVDDRGNVKLADFGCALVLKDDHSDDGVEMSMKGTPVFMAPEMLLKQKCGRRVDVWSLGCAVIEMITTRPPWADTFKHPFEIIQHFSENPGPPPLPDNLSTTLLGFLLACFTWDAELRPSAQELCGHPYLRGQPGPPTTDGSGGDDVPLEKMDRATAVTRMRRCSSATLDLLAVQARKSAIGVSIGGGTLATFSTAPSGTFRPPSPRYGPPSLGTHNRRTPNRRRMYTEAFLPPPEGVAPSFASAKAAASDAVSPGVSATPGSEATQAFSSHITRSPPMSPEKPRRPGRGSSTPAHLRSSRNGIDHSTSSRSVCSADSDSGSGGGQADGGSRPCQPVSSRGDTCSANPAVSATVVAAAESSAPSVPPLAQEILGEGIDGGLAAGADLELSSDTPPPTVRPLEVRHPTPARALVPERAPLSGSDPVMNPSRSGNVDSKGSWCMSDARASVS